MATVQCFPIATEITEELGTLQNIPNIQAVYSKWYDQTYVVWIGILHDDATARKAVYQLEDRISNIFKSVLFDFNVIALPDGKKTEDYVSNAERVFQHNA